MTTISLSLALDILIIIVSGIAMLYCAALNRRIRKLNDLESGLGATIVKLTNSIEETHRAAKEAQSSALSSVSRLNELINEAQDATPKVDALIVELNRTRTKAEKDCMDTLKEVEDAIRPTIQEAVKTSQNLLELLTLLQIHKGKLGDDNNNIVRLNRAAERILR